MEKYLVSARKYRPSTFASVIGQKALTATLKNAVASGRLAHSYLFCGSRGVGKTSCARIFAKTINCEHPTPDGEACNQCPSCQAFNSGSSMNIIELDAASNNGVDDMRSLIEQVQVPPSQGRYRVFIVDEVHMLSSAAFNAFLKTLEEPPSYVIFILATTEKHKIIPTILSRCQIYDFHRITTQDMVDHLAHVAASEGMTAEPAALNVIAVKADGAMRDALSIFDQVAAASGGNITYRHAIDNLNVLDYEYYHRLLDAILHSDVLATWLIYKEIRDAGFDSQFFINGLANYFRDIMVARDPATISLLEVSDDIRQQFAQRAALCSPQFLYRAMSLCNDADLNYRTASSKQFLIELTLAKICQQLSPSPSNNDGDGEGQLKPIAAPSSTPHPTPQPTASPAPAPQKTTPQPATPQAAPHPMPTPPPPAPRHTTLKTTISAPSISIKHPAPSTAAPAAAKQPEPQRNQPFSDDALQSAWLTYIKTHPKAHILINTMRASMPQRIDPNTFTITVQNQMQSQTVDANRQSILSHLRNTLANDFIQFSILINTDAAPRHTLSDSELLQELRADFPTLNKYITTFNLRLS